MGLQLKQLRRARHMTQKELAAKIGQTDRVVGAWERGESSLPIDDAARIADVFDVSLDELAGRQFPHPKTAPLSKNEHRIISAYRSASPQGRAAIEAVAQSQEGMEEQSASDLAPTA